MLRSHPTVRKICTSKTKAGLASLEPYILRIIYIPKGPERISRSNTIGVHNLWKREPRLTGTVSRGKRMIIRALVILYDGCSNTVLCSMEAEMETGKGGLLLERNKPALEII
jgi:hypothetical protein